MRVFWYAAIVGLLLVGAYIGGYYALVLRDLGASESDSPPTKIPSPRKIAIVPVYRFGGETAVTFFSPWHAVDRRIRSEYWSFDEYLKQLLVRD